VFRRRLVRTATLHDEPRRPLRRERPAPLPKSAKAREIDVYVRGRSYGGPGAGKSVGCITHQHMNEQLSAEACSE